LEEWNRFRATVTGDSARNLVELARRLELNDVASRLLRKRKLGLRLLAIRTLGHMGDKSYWKDFFEHLDDANTALSVTCAAALIEVDPDAGSPIVMPRILARADWPRVSVAAMLKAAGPTRITLPMCQAILASEPETAVRLLRFAEFLRPENVEQVVEAILRERTEPAVIAAALKAVPGINAVPGITRLAGHEAWYVRMQTARILGRCAEERDLPVLERLLGDREWWVRYRAAQSIVSLPFLGPNGLRALVARQTDRYAIDMMHHAMAEVGL